MAKREIVQIKDKETGDINELRDKALMVAEKSSTPSVATNNSVIPLEKEDGEIIKIKAGSLMKAFASMINSNSKSTITTLFGALTANNNTEFGAINMSNLASLLGDHRTEVWDFKWTSTTYGETTNYMTPFSSAVYIIAYDSNFSRAGLVYINIPENKIEFIGNPYGLSAYFEISISNGGRIDIKRKGQNVEITLGIKCLV